MYLEGDEPLPVKQKSEASRDASWIAPEMAVTSPGKDERTMLV